MPSPDVFVNGLHRCLSKYVPSRFPEHDAVRYKAFREKWNEKSPGFHALTMQKSWESMIFTELRSAMWPKAPPSEMKEGKRDPYTESIYGIWQTTLLMVGRETIREYQVYCSSKLNGDVKERFEKRFQDLWNHKSPTQYNDKQILAGLVNVFGDRIEKDYIKFKSLRRKDSSSSAEQKRNKLLQQQMSTELLVKFIHCVRSKEKNCILTNTVKMKMLNMKAHISTYPHHFCVTSVLQSFSHVMIEHTRTHTQVLVRIRSVRSSGVRH